MITDEQMSYWRQAAFYATPSVLCDAVPALIKEVLRLREERDEARRANVYARAGWYEGDTEKGMAESLYGKEEADRLFPQNEEAK